jgi:phosphoribosylformimino-5-aminoimidazole carboxamide ribotide isomerase
VVTDRWQRFSELVVDGATLGALAAHCAEFLVHGVDVEGRRLGVDGTLVALLGAHTPIPATYAGGVRALVRPHRMLRCHAQLARTPAPSPHTFPACR